MCVLLISHPWIFMAIVMLAPSATYGMRTKRMSRFERAQAHYDRIYKRIQCKQPLPRVIHLEPREDRKFLPSATILHRCGDTAGCCDSPQERCSAKTKVKVHLYFFVIKATSISRKSEKHQVQRLTFTNHTECHCTEKQKIPR